MLETSLQKKAGARTRGKYKGCKPVNKIERDMIAGQKLRMDEEIELKGHKGPGSKIYGIRMIKVQRQNIFKK